MILHLMGKTKIQSFVSLVLSSCQVVVFLLRAHVVPSYLTGFVSSYIVAFDEDGHNNVPRHKCEENFVSSPVVWFIISSIDLLTN